MEGKEIEKSEDVKEFAGEIVCFEVKNFGYILPRNTEWPKPRGWENLNFGYISKNMSDWGGEVGYNMAIFKGKKEVASNCALLNQYIRQAGLTMRIANSEEVKMLHMAYRAREGKFEYLGWPEYQV